MWAIQRGGPPTPGSRQLFAYRLPACRSAAASGEPPARMCLHTGNELPARLPALTLTLTRGDSFRGGGATEPSLRRPAVQQQHGESSAGCSPSEAPEPPWIFNSSFKLLQIHFSQTTRGNLKEEAMRQASPKLLRAVAMGRCCPETTEGNVKLPSKSKAKPRAEMPQTPCHLSSPDTEKLNRAASALDPHRLQAAGEIQGFILCISPETIQIRTAPSKQPRAYANVHAVIYRVFSFQLPCVCAGHASKYTSATRDQAPMCTQNSHR